MAVNTSPCTNRKRGGDTMTLHETLRLADWLEKQGYTVEKIRECLRYIVSAKEKPTDATDKVKR